MTEILTLVDDLHREALSFLDSALHAEAESRLEKYVSCAFEQGPILLELAEHLRKNNKSFTKSLTQLSTEHATPARKPLLARFAHLANQSHANISGRGGPVPPPARDLP
jgi:hypothetical protein